MLFRGGLREVEVVLAEFDMVGLGVDDILIDPSSGDNSHTMSFESGVRCRWDISSIVGKNVYVDYGGLDYIARRSI